MEFGLIEVVRRGIRFLTKKGDATYVAISPPATAPTNAITLTLFNALPGTTQAITVDSVGQLGTAALGGGSALAAPTALNVTALNILSMLPVAPSATGRIILFVDGVAEFSVGASPSFTVSGQNLTWTPLNAGYPLTTDMKVFALVW